MPNLFAGIKKFIKPSNNNLPDKITKLTLSSSNKEDYELFTNIYKKVTRENHKYASPQKGDGTIKKCIELFKEGASPEVLTKLEKSLKEQEESYNYYTKKFLQCWKQK